MSVRSRIQEILAGRFFSRAEGAQDHLDVIKWWELRRVAFNLIVGATGLFTVMVTVVVAVIAEKSLANRSVCLIPRSLRFLP